MAGYNNLQAMRDMQLASQMGAIAEAMGAPGTANTMANTSNQPTLDPRGALNPNYQEPLPTRITPGQGNEDQRAIFNRLQSEGISSTPWAAALSAGGPPTQTGNPWSGEQMERLRLLEPRDRQQLLEGLARESAPAASPQEMQQPGRFRMHGDRWRQFTGQPNGNPFSVPTNEEMERYKRHQENHPLNRFRNFIQNKMDQFRR